MMVGDHQYELRNITLHTPSEHSVGNRHFNMELQLNHEDDFGNMASVAILFSSVEKLEGNFAQQYGRTDFWSGYVANKGVTRGAHLSLLPYLPKTKADSNFYAYPGSQTHPPCSEGVQWLVMRKVHQVKQTEVQNLMKQFSSNARPQQASLGREISFF